MIYREKGFTLIELLVTLLVIGILASIAVSNFLTAIQKGKQISTMGGMKTIGEVLEVYAIDKDTYPAFVGADQATWDNITNELQLEKGELAPFQSKDGWKNFFYYEFPFTSPDGTISYKIHSYGKNGTDDPLISPATRNQFDLDIEYSDGAFTGAPR